MESRRLGRLSWPDFSALRMACQSAVTVFRSPPAGEGGVAQLDSWSSPRPV